MVLKYVIKKDDDFNNVRSVLKKHFRVSTRLQLKLNKFKMIFLNGSICTLNDLVSEGDVISFSLDYEEDNSNIVPIKMDLDIVYEDNSFLIINKPPFMPVHPTTYHFEDTLSNGVKFYFDTIGLKKKIRPVNRLDNGTSGLVVFAKNEYVQEALIVQMNNGIFVKKYLGIIEGNLNLYTDMVKVGESYNNSFDDSLSFILVEKNSKGEISGLISAPIARKEDSIIERKVSTDGFYACTYYKIVQSSDQYSLIEFSLLTGRTHQIRVHTQYLGHPLLGDSLYGKESPLINRQALHSFYLRFIHPITNEIVELQSDLPLDMKKIHI